MTGLIASPIWAQSTVTQLAEKKLSLPEAVMLALRQNHSVRSAYLNRVVQKFSLEVNEAIFDPTGTLSFTTTKTGSRSGGTNSTMETWSATPIISWETPIGASFTFSWANSGISTTKSSSSILSVGMTLPLMKGAGMDVNQAPLIQARNTEKMYLLNLRTTLATTISSVIQGYRALLLAQRALDISRRSLERSHKRLEINRILIENGRMPRHDLVQAEADAASREISLASEENSLDRARFSLLELLDMNKHTRIILTEPLEVVEVDLETEPLLQLAMNEEPDILLSRLSLENLHLSKLVADSNRRWQLDLSVLASRSTTDDRFGPSLKGAPDQDWSVGLNLGIPFGDLNLPFKDKSLDSAPLQARIAVEQAKISLLQLRHQLELSVLNAVRNAKIKWRQIDLARRALVLSKRKLEIELIKLRTGRSTNFKMVQFENDLVTAEHTEITAKINYLNALTALDQILGTTLDTWKIELEPKS